MENQRVSLGSDGRRTQLLTTNWMFHQGELALPPARLSFKGGGCGSVSDLVRDEQASGVDNPLAVLATLVPGLEQILHVRVVETLGSA
jgi:hypothetical protein